MTGTLLKDRTAFVTGAASGIGLRVAQELAAEGARVALADLDATAVERAAAAAVDRARRDRGPSFLRMRVPRLDGHFLGDVLVRAAAAPASEGRETLSSVAAAALSRSGAGLAARAGGVLKLLDLLRRARRQDRDTRRDPLERARRALGGEADRIEADAAAEISRAVAAALAEAER